MIKEIASSVPEGHVVDLEHADVFILVEIFKVPLDHAPGVSLSFRLYSDLFFFQSVCGISVVRDYYAMQKFNVMEIANAKRHGDENMDQI